MNELPKQQKNHPADQATKNTLKNLIPAVGTAFLATILGFMALFRSPVPMVQDFGKMLTLGIFISLIASIFLLAPILFLRDRYFMNPLKNSLRSHRHRKRTGLERGLERLASKVISFRWGILPLALTVTVIGIWADLRVGVQTDVETFMPQDTQELKDIHHVRNVLGSTDQVTIVYEGESIIEGEILPWVDEITTSLEKEYPDKVVSVKSLTSVLRQMNGGDLPKPKDVADAVDQVPKNQRKMLMNEDETKGSVVVSIKHLEAEKLKQFIADLNQYLEDESVSGVQTTVTGKSVLDVEMVSALTTGRHQMTLWGMGMVFIGLLLVYRHPIKALVPLLPISLIVGWSGVAMYFLGFEYTPLTATLGALIIGIGTEFTILLMERFYEERRNGKVSVDAMVTAVGKIGKAVIASGLTTVGGFSALLISDFPILQDFGFMTLINMLLALLSTLVILPAIMVLMDRLVKTEMKTGI